MLKTYQKRHSRVSPLIGHAERLHARRYTDGNCDRPRLPVLAVATDGRQSYAATLGGRVHGYI